MANLKALAKGVQSKALASLKGFLQKKSVYDATSIKEGAPFGEGVKSALDYLAKLGKDLGFEVDTCDGYVTEITANKGHGPLIGVYAHADVVPATGAWKSKNPFSPVIEGEGKEAKIIARGSSDDKGPLIAALYAMKILNDAHLIDGYSVRLCAGGDEERGSGCLKHYFDALKKPDSVLGFTPDADFPLIYAEKGMARGGKLVQSIDLSPIVSMDGGSVSNAVCDKFLVTVPSDPKLEAAFQAKGISGEVRKEGKIMILVFQGKTAHASTPELGDSAILKAFAFLGEYYKNAFLSNLAKVLSDTRGKGFGGESTSPILGEATYNFGIGSYESYKHTLTLSIDYRYGEEAKPEQAMERLAKATGMEAQVGGYVKPLLYDKDSVLVSTLMKSYRRTTWKLFDKPIAIGGGTYAKEAKNCVAYGSAFEGHPGDIHAPNEYLYLEDFYRQIYIYADAILSLGKAAK